MHRSPENRHVDVDSRLGAGEDASEEGKKKKKKKYKKERRGLVPYDVVALCACALGATAANVAHIHVHKLRKEW